MNNNIKEQFKNIANNVSKNKLGFDIFTESGLNYMEMAKSYPEIKDMIKSRKQVNVEVREKEELDNTEEAIEFFENTIIIFKSPNEYAKFVVDYIINEFDTINNAISQVCKGQHNDRVALINSAIQEYEKALYTIDESYKKESFKRAEDLLTEGMNKLVLEMNNNCENIFKIPTGVIKKMFCRVTPQNVMEYTDLLRESMIVYENSLHLMFRLSLERNEPDRIIPTLDSAASFIENTFLQNENYKIIDSFDYRDDNFWMTKPLELEKSLYKLKEKKVTGNYKILIDIKE